MLHYIYYLITGRQFIFADIIYETQLETQLNDDGFLPIADRRFCNCLT